jgi:hypothetical protein
MRIIAAGQLILDLLISSIALLGREVIMSENQENYNSRLANYPRPAIALTAVIYLLLGILETLPGTYVPALLYFFAAGILALIVSPTFWGCPTVANRCGNFATTSACCR